MGYTGDTGWSIWGHWGYVTVNHGIYVDQGRGNRGSMDIRGSRVGYVSREGNMGVTWTLFGMGVKWWVFFLHNMKYLAVKAAVKR